MKGSCEEQTSEGMAGGPEVGEGMGHAPHGACRFLKELQLLFLAQHGRVSGQSDVL